MLSEPFIAPALPSQGAVPTGEVVTTGYGKTGNAGFPNERREVFLDVTPRWTCEGIYQFVKPITPGMNCTRMLRPDGRSMRHWVMSSSESSPEISLASAATRPIPP
ncbi:serine protease family protein [Actinomadura rudentiformis]|uniref:hypothetical protein n=1 Tax=Actinomadura rudentiformis TaxID=359158 RepID=UPI00124D0FEB|nr:hypothetical protein [Actinomadura rudentiformis]